MGEANGYGAVVCHRWFAGGAGWAFHPAAAGYEPAQNPGLAAALTAGREEFQVISCPAPDGVFWGEHAPDSNCPDPKAAGRKATILRVAYLPAPPAAAHQAALLAALRELTPTAPGPDARLRLPPATPGLAPSAAGRRWGAALALVAVAVGVGAWAATSSPHVPTPTAATPAAPAPPPDPMPPTPPVPGPATPTPLTRVQAFADGVNKSGGLAAWGTTPPAGKTEADRLLNGFFAALTVPKDMPKAATHPDYAFARRFPPTAPAHESWTDDDLSAAQENLFAHGLPAPPGKGDPNVQAILAAGDYATWLREEVKQKRVKLTGEPVSAGKKVEFRFPLDAPAASAARALALRFCPAKADAADAATARECLRYLIGWGVKGIDTTDADRRPDLLLLAFPAALSLDPFRDKLASIEPSREYAFLCNAFDIKGVEAEAASAKRPREVAERVLHKAFPSNRQTLGKAIDHGRETTRTSQRTQDHDFLAYFNRLTPGQAKSPDPYPSEEHPR